MADIQDTNPSANGPEDTQAPAEGSSEGGFSEAFAERAAPVEAEAKPSETPAAEASAATGEQPADKAGSSEAPSKEAADASSGTEAKAFDPYAGLTPEQKAHFDKLAASDRSNRGRVGALTKKLNGLAAGTQAPPKAEPSSSREEGDGGAGASETGSGEETPTDIEKRLKAVTDEYGDILGPIPEVIAELRKEISTLKASSARSEVNTDAEAMAEAYGKLEAAHPDFRDYNENNQQFVDWFTKQSSGIQALVNSQDPAETSLALQLFKTEHGIASSAKPAADTTDAGEGGNGDTATGDRRARQLDGLTNAPNKGAPTVAGVPNDFSSAFKARQAQKT
jgi:hypothetical protein